MKKLIILFSLIFLVLMSGCVYKEAATNGDETANKIYSQNNKDNDEDNIDSVTVKPSVEVPTVTEAPKLEWNERIKQANFRYKTPQLVWVNCEEQKTYVFTYSNGKYTLKKEMLCSTGKKGWDTPTGEYNVTDNKWSWMWFSKYDSGAKYITQIHGNYLFHSVPMDKQKNVVDETLGEPLSHGCVRLAVEDAKWIYDNIKTGTTVYIE